MKAKRLTALVVVSLVLILVIAPGSAGAGSTWTSCNGTEQNRVVLDEGTWVVRGDTVHGRGMLSTYEESADCPQLGGLNTVTMNANWDLNGVGPMWGSGRLETDYNGGGVWEGSWQGAIGADGTCTYKAVVHGVSGSVKGLKSFLFADCSGVVTTFTAILLDPGGE